MVSKKALLLLGVLLAQGSVSATITHQALVRPINLISLTAAVAFHIGVLDNRDKITRFLQRKGFLKPEVTAQERAADGVYEKYSQVITTLSEK